MAAPNASLWHWAELGEVDSTNRLAMDEILSRWQRGASADRLAIVARRQTTGRGQHGRSWASPEGGLYLSLVLEDVPVEWRERLALVAGLVVIQTLGGGEGLQIRWPNDILLDGKKVAGILCQVAAQGERWAAIIGIGVNVAWIDFPVELQAIATCLAADSRFAALTADSLAAAIAQEWDALLRDSPALQTIISGVRRLDGLRGKRVRFDPGGGQARFDATAEGIDEQGRLLLRRGEWEITAHDSGTLVVLEP